MKIFKLDNQFNPLPVEENDELFPNGIFEFNISQLIRFIKSAPDTFPVESVELRLLSRLTSDNLNESAIENADLTDPIIIAEISPDMFNVIDGNHRLEKARRASLSSIPAYRVYADQHIRFLTSVNAYLKYIEYWNSKVDERVLNS